MVTGDGSNKDKEEPDMSNTIGGGGTLTVAQLAPGQDLSKVDQNGGMVAVILPQSPTNSATPADPSGGGLNLADAAPCPGCNGAAQNLQGGVNV